MGKYPKISIVTQCFNRENYIAETIESVLGQGYPNLEYIVIDDNSTDGSWDIIKQYEDKLAYAERLEGNRKTPVPAINYGFSKATGDILGWLNTKNILLHKSLFSVADIFNKFGNIEWLTGLETTIDAESRVVSVKPYRKNIYDYLAGESGLIQQESTFWSSSLWEKAGGKLSEEYRWAFDVALWMKFFQYTEIYYADTIFGAYRKIPQGQNIKNRDEFNEYKENAINELKENAPAKDIKLSKYYKALRPFSKLLRNIPESMYHKMPLLRNFYHPVVKYNIQKNEWVMQKTNQFKS